MKRNIILICVLVMLGLTSSCSLDSNSADRDSEDIPNEAAMRQILDGVYGQITDYRFWGRNVIIAGEVRADNVYANGSSNRFTRMSQMKLLSTDADVAGIFQYGYNSIVNSNAVINGDITGTKGNEANKFHMLGEAYALRALIHFDLLRLYGQQYIDDGNNLGISYNKNFRGEDLETPRESVESNKTDLYNDIDDAITYLTQASSSEYSSTKTYLTLNAAYALKSRVATYFKDYLISKTASEVIVDSYTITPVAHVVDYWAQTTPGAASIFELAQSKVDENQVVNGISNIYRGTVYGDIQLFDDLLTDMEFESSDIRASSDMIGLQGSRLRNMGKYPSSGAELGSDNIKVFRIEEIVLNHAEALLETGEAGPALTYLNKITDNRDATAYTEATIENILKERRKELLFEGFRFHDLARHYLGIRDLDPTSINNHGVIPAGDNKFAMPIPKGEVDTNTGSIQNPGY